MRDRRMGMGRRESGFGRDSGGFGRTWGRSFNMEKPVNEGEEYTVVIKELGSQGDGISRVKNFVIFVPGTAKGDTVRIKIKSVRGRHAIGEVMPEGPAEKAEPQAEPLPAPEPLPQPEPLPGEGEAQADGEQINFAG